jgi:DedD protein
MSEPGFREIQLSTKQVVFLFIAGLAVAVAIFLLGVSVGRGVTPERTTADAAPADPATDVAVPEKMPPPTAPKPDELKYHEDLQGKPGARGATAPPAVPDAPPEPTPTPTPATPTPTPTPASSPVPSQSGGFFVQVASFGSKANADKQVASLKAMGVASAIFDAGGSGARYRVRVGPFADRAAAEAMQARLRKEGLRPSITPR